MARPITRPPHDGATHPPERRGPSARLVSVLLALFVMLGGLILSPSVAQAATLGTGYGDENLFIGAYSSHGRQAYCMDLGASSPWGSTNPPSLETALDGLTRQQLAELNYVMGRWGESRDPNITSAVAMFVWDVADHDPYVAYGGDARLLTRVPASQQAIVMANLGAIREAARTEAVADPSLALAVTMADQYQGTLTIGTTPGSLTGPVTLTDATFADGSRTKALGAGTYPIIGTPAVGVPEYRISAVMSSQAAGFGAGVDLFYTPGAQRILATASFQPLTAQASSPVIPLDFQPEIGTQVVTKFVQQGDQLTDRLAVTVTKGTWIVVNGKPVPVVADGTLYGPLDEQPSEADAPPVGTPVAGRVQATLTGAGTVVSPGITAPESGFYTWVWQIDKKKQGSNAKYLADFFTDRYGRVAETNVVPFQPEAVSKANGKLVKPGDEVTDTITVSSTNGAWLKQGGTHIPVVFEGTAYQVPGTLPPVEGTQIPVDAVALGTVQVTATGPGTYTSPKATVLSGGFVTWVWQVRKSAQPEWVRPFLAADWQDQYGINVETHSVRWPLTITSEMREYNVHEGGRAFDKITVTGFPDNHPDFTGDGYWQPDTKTLTHTVYGPFASDTELTTDLDLASAPVLTSIETPAKNGVYNIGYDDTERIEPTEPGYYVIVTSFAGDDRVQPYISSPGDIWERFFVPGAKQPVSVITQATPTALVGEEFEDTALVQGTTIPDGSYLVFRAYGPQSGDAAPVCESPFFTSKRVPVTQAGLYRSGSTSVDQPGNVYWVETLYDKAGSVLSQGRCGAPGETTVVTEQPEQVTVSTKAVPTVQLGDPAHDTAIITGKPPAGATLTFEAYRQDGQTPVCTTDTRVFATDPVTVEGPGEVTSVPVIFEKVGTYYWTETLKDRDGTVIHRGLCGAPGETTTVTTIPPSTRLAQTGAGGWIMPLGIGAGLAALAGAIALLVGRRLAPARGLKNEEGEEPSSIHDLFDETEA
ncbi:hypothetical protein G7067_05655 [Leucobacter insecticola]|uniref:Uncharacterized protein n=1 Tax=Leucobacter insecticola TaxID=2714934 RepID=A0A6G8FI26_9MICO|nr:hypothetical protein [Leucobacter insecticola]QIM16017.1 hypothetical protein G7067_05655 [Leucobacter insecticola]